MGMSWITRNNRGEHVSEEVCCTSMEPDGSCRDCGPAVPTVSEHTRCKHCGHAKYAHILRELDPAPHVAHNGPECVACGCIRFEARAKRDPATQPQWLVTVGFNTSKGVRQGTVRIHAAGQAGAIVKAIRQVKREVLKPRQRTTGVVVNVVRIKGGS